MGSFDMGFFLVMKCFYLIIVDISYVMLILF